MRRVAVQRPRGEVAGWLSTAPERYRDEFMTPASHALTFLAETLARHKVLAGQGPEWRTACELHVKFRARPQDS